MRSVSQGLSFSMKNRQLTWLHSCLLGQGRHDYRAEMVPPIFSSMDQHAFQGVQMSRRWEGWPQLLLLLFCWCCCFPQRCRRCLSRCYPWTCTAFIGLGSIRTQDYVSGSYSIISSSFKYFILHRCCPNLFLVWVCSDSPSTSGNVLVFRVHWVQIQFIHEYFLLAPVVLLLHGFVSSHKKQIYLIPYRPNTILVS